MESMESFHHQLDLHGLRELPKVSYLSNSGMNFQQKQQLLLLLERYISSSAQELVGETDVQIKEGNRGDGDSHKCPHLHFFLRAFLR